MHCVQADIYPAEILGVLKHPSCQSFEANCLRAFAPVVRHGLRRYALPAADHGCPFYPSYSNSDLQPLNFNFHLSTPGGDKSLILPGYEVVSYYSPGLSHVTGFMIWNASWYWPINDAYIAAVALLCEDGMGRHPKRLDDIRRKLRQANDFVQTKVAVSQFLKNHNRLV